RRHPPSPPSPHRSLMLALAGFILLPICVFGVYAIHGGSLGPVLHALPFEFAMIGGAAIASFLVANSSHTVKHTLHDVKKVIAGPKFRKDDYRDLLCLLFRLVRLAKAKGATALEAHIERPQESAAYQEYPRILGDALAVSLICDYLRMTTMNQNNPHQVEDILGEELEKVHAENMHVSHALQSTADALPALGIVAAVLGVIKTMASINEPPAVLGGMIGSALVGTFLGILLAYGVFGPIANRVKEIHEADSKYLQAIKAGLVAHLQGYAPAVSIEVARKVLLSDMRPTFREVEEATGKLLPV